MTHKQLIPKGGNDKIYTPEYLAKAIIEHFKPTGLILEPCAGTGNFLKYLPKDTLWCEIDKGKDFFDFNQQVDYIITNPPYSLMRKFLQHSMKVSDNVIFLTSINHLWLKARIRDIEEAGFGIKEICLCDTPKEFPQSGFQFGIFHLEKNYKGNILFTKLKIKEE